MQLNMPNNNQNYPVGASATSQIKPGTPSNIDTRNNFISPLSRSNVSKCNMGPRKNRVGINGTFTSFPFFFTDKVVQGSGRVQE